MFLQSLYRGAIWRINPSSRVVYLTFDDGPIPSVTPALLDILAAEGVKATFFMVADNARRYPELLERVRREGHAIGNHTTHHLKGTKYSLSTYMDDVHQAEEILSTSPLDSQTKLPFRPPYGRLWPWQKIALLREGYSIYLWDVLTHDYDKTYSPERMLAIIKKYTRNGSIINFHDSIKSSDRMLATVPEAIHWLREQGYQFETI